MLKLLLDEHLSPDVAEGLRRRVKALSVHGLAEWKDGCFLGRADDAILEEAAAHTHVPSFSAITDSAELF